MTFFIVIFISWVLVSLLRRAFRRLLREWDAHAARRGKPMPLWKLRQKLTAPLWGYRRGQVIASLLTAGMCLWLVLSTFAPWARPPWILRMDVSHSTNQLATLYGAPPAWLAVPKSASLEETIDRFERYPFPRLHLTYPASTQSTQPDLGGVIICETQSTAAQQNCRLRVATELRSLPGETINGIQIAPPARMAAAFSTDGKALNVHWHQSLEYTASAAKGEAVFAGGPVPTASPIAISPEWLIAAASGDNAPAIVADWPFETLENTNHYVFAHAGEQALFATFLSASKLTDKGILEGHDLSALTQGVLQDYVTIFGHVDQSPAIAQLLTAPVPNSNDATAITAALARQPQTSPLYFRRDVHAKAVYEALLADLREVGLLP
ncbi:hypothetical protein JHL21_09630 [Devosia sp. WQ 349]|uniref:hypothetical protein n=1 Tax=Devosia sp. WQ 349K1 TaxID=2800329 RepID=UPI0019046F73|nr:hypothetical protein [Devosia sp. WQ 349K1]MBK1794762.1 hypothetical protein [Devosia sp. WQ 349K1]